MAGQLKTDDGTLTSELVSPTTLIIDDGTLNGCDSGIVYVAPIGTLHCGTL